ncbi:Thrombospondin type 1 domain family protein [Acanthocheilonema viteae]
MVKVTESTIDKTTAVIATITAPPGTKIVMTSTMTVTALPTSTAAAVLTTVASAAAATTLIAATSVPITAPTTAIPAIAISSTTAIMPTPEAPMPTTAAAKYTPSAAVLTTAAIIPTPATPMPTTAAAKYPIPAAVFTTEATKYPPPAAVLTTAAKYTPSAAVLTTAAIMPTPAALTTAAAKYPSPAAVLTTAAAKYPTPADVLTTVAIMPTPTASMPTTAAVKSTPPSATPSTAAIMPIPAAPVPPTAAARPPTISTIPVATPTIPTTKITAITVATSVPTNDMVTDSTVPSVTMKITTNSQSRHQYVLSKNLNEKRFILQDNKTRSKRQLELCRACNNIPAIRADSLASGERNGHLLVIYGANPSGCRTANLICDGTFLTRQIAIIYANGIKNSPLAMSPTGSVQVTLTCDNNICWRAPNSGMNIWNVTCIFRDQPIPTTSLPPTTTPIPCSTCTNIRAERVRNPALNEANGKLTIEYTYNEFGCRIAFIHCNSSDDNAETTIYFNGMKNLPYVSSRTGHSIIFLVCGDNLRFRATGSRTNVESVTCLSRAIPTTPSIMTTTTARAVPSPITTTIIPIIPLTMTMPPSPPTTPAVPLPCTRCENLKGRQLIGLRSNEINGPLVIEYSRQADGCRKANIICGTVKNWTTARIFFNEEMNLPFISDITGKAELELICGSNSRWRAFESRIDVASVSCLLIALLSTPSTVSPQLRTHSQPLMPTLTTPLRCQAQWATWGAWSTCTDTCGAYGTRQRFRGCERTNEDCFCPGSISEMELCNLQPCLYPRNACRPNYTVSSVNQKFVCVPIQS